MLVKVDSVEFPTILINIFLDCCIRLYDTPSSRTFQRLAEIAVEDVGWSILDTALSPDRSNIAYSTWSECSKFKI